MATNAGTRQSSGGGVVLRIRPDIRAPVNVRENSATFFNGGDNLGKIIIEQDDVSRFARHVASATAQRYADVPLLESRRIVHAIARFALTLECAHDGHFLIGGHAEQSVRLD